MSTSRTLFSLALVALVASSTGCDTLRARARAQKGVEKYRDGDIAEAARLFREAAEIDSTVPPIIINRGFTHLALYQLNPRSKEGQDAANIAVQSFRQYMDMPKLKPEQRQRARDYLLQTFVDAKKYDEAVDFFKPQVERENPDIEALTILGNIAKSIGKLDACRMWLERRVKANPKDTDGYVSLAIMTWDELCADSQCRTALELRRNQLQMAFADRIAKANEALDLIEHARQLSPQAPTPAIYGNLLLRERSYAQPNDDLKRQDLEDAGKLLQLALAMQKAATQAQAAAAAAAAGKSAEAGKPAEAGAKPAATGAAPSAPAAPSAATTPSTPAAPSPATSPVAPSAPAAPAAPTAASAPAAAAVAPAAPPSAAPAVKKQKKKVVEPASDLPPPADAPFAAPSPEKKESPPPAKEEGSPAATEKQ
jgi:Tfp pilus assembly protein PilF